jgi:acyl-CoA synthetase (AMP-forming)/AMP-acid ligase II
MTARSPAGESLRRAQRKVPLELAHRYRSQGHWTDDSLGSVLWTALREHSDRRMSVWSQMRPWHGSIGQVFDLAQRTASALRARGIGPGDVVSFQLPNWMEAAAAFWGASLLGAAVVPIVHIYGRKETSYILADSRARLHFTAARFGRTEHLENVRGMRGQLPNLETVVVVGGEARGCDEVNFEDLLSHDPIAEPVRVASETPAMVCYTSGTTADPKGVIHSHRTLLFDVRQLMARHAPMLRPTASPLPPLTASPVTHVTGLETGLLKPVLEGQDLHLLDRWDAGSVLATIAKEDLSIAPGASFFIDSLLEHPDFRPEHLDHLRYVRLGGGPISAELTERLDALGLVVTRAYGCTEHLSVMTSALDAPREERLYTEGRPLLGVEIRVASENGTPVSQGSPGELQTRGPDLFEGYTDPILTRAAVDDDGWYRTGDVVIEDGRGCFTITDRIKDIIIRGGENISAAEVEQALTRHRSIAEAAAVAMPDPHLGERTCAFLRLTPGAVAPGLDEMRAHLEQLGLARQKWPEKLWVVDDFDRTASGKVRKNVLRDRARRETL